MPSRVGKSPAEKLSALMEEVDAVRFGIVRLSLHDEDDPGDVSLQRIYTDGTRNEGHATSVMEALARAAGKLGVTLYLEALPEDDDGDPERLVEFYKRFGFLGGEEDSHGCRMMWRPPVKYVPIDRPAGGPRR